ncbi:HEAT repeat domain-containing protein [Oscillatoria acuminata]|uniref:PBS lyase HEAT-like repeat protein n=1 Tax=Oscillatoria acuminata PCC 6304 TaxID=56110 RepID=K9TIV1_9CYAN|nr:PBS lyase HEAT-like repeat protein [Oscillatoria acuminata]AFY81949.1 PBS lyase HEAT-like repeat protein [Oscillatoria acuminata PCC 6304]
MTLETYSHPVNQLLSFGDCFKIKNDTNYLEKFGFTPEHIPELIRMTVDPELNWAESDTLEVWAPVHAWRSLGQLRAEEAIDPLISILDEIEDIDWTSREMPSVFGKIGPAAIPSLAAYLDNPAPDIYHLSIPASCLQKIGTEHPDSRDECVKILTEKLAKFQENDPTFNGFLLLDLVKLKAVESVPVIQSAFAADCIDESIMGDWDEVQFRLGLGPRKNPENIRKAKVHEAMMELLKNQGEAQPSKGFSSSIKKTPKKGQKKKKGK